MKKIKIWNIVWDTNGKDIGNLPEEVIIDDLPQEELEDLTGWLNGDLADELSDRYGFCVESFNAETIED